VSLSLSLSLSLKFNEGKGKQVSRKEKKRKTRLRAFSFSLLEPILFQKREKRLLPHSSNTKDRVALGEGPSPRKQQG
jgi:hypothetical protein